MIVISFVVLLVVIIAIISAVYNMHYGIGDVKIKFQTEGGTTIRTGRGRSIGEAVADGIKNLYDSLSLSSQTNTIESRLLSMKSTLAEYRRRMFAADIEASEKYIALTQSLLNKKKAQEQAKEQEKALEEQTRREKAEKKRRQQREREKERARIREEREKTLPAQRRFVQEQRRLMTDKLRYKVMERDGFRCQICGATQADGYKLHVDHIYPVSKGGKTEMSNLRTLCERCNMGKGSDIENVPLIAPQKSNQRSEPPYNAAMLLLRDQSQEFVDKTSSGGALYFFSKTVVQELKKRGYSVYYAPNGTKGTEHRAAWFVK